ncbi:hypothetical protein [Janibacter sp. GXQ6167]|uniref:hypothetical protein n=1 Tax=Janibacter sp. GXQ6167 TaxID=3240791 RepID=UPI003524EFFC
MARRAVVLAVTALVAAPVFAGTNAQAAPAAPAEIWTLNNKVSIETYSAKMKKTLKTSGTSVSQFDTSNGSLTSTVEVAPFKTKLTIGRHPLADVTIVQEPVGPSTGTLKDLVINTTQKANIRITRISPAGMPWLNLVNPKTCKTVTTTDINVTGKMTNIFEPTTLTGTYTIPKFRGCGPIPGGAIDSIISDMVSGPGNKVTMTLTP